MSGGRIAIEIPDRNTRSKLFSASSGTSQGGENSVRAAAAERQ